MSGIDVGKLKDVADDPLLDDFKKISVPHGWVEGAWSGTATIPDPQYMTVGERHAMQSMQPDEFAQAYTLDHFAKTVGLINPGQIAPSDALPPEATDILRKYRTLRAKGMADEIRIRQIADSREVVPGALRVAESVGRGMLSLGEMAVVELPKLLLNMMAPAGGYTKQGGGDIAQNWAMSQLGIEGTGRPDPGLYLEALTRKIAGSDQPISDTYKDLLRAEDMRLGSEGLVQRIGEGVGKFLGETGPLFVGPLAKGLGAVEQGVGEAIFENRLVEKAIAYGASKAPTIVPKLAEAAKLMTSPGLRMGAHAALAAEGDGMERAGAFAFGAVMAPVATWLSSFASKMAVGAIKDAPRFNAAFADWMESSPAAAHIPDAEAGLKAFLEAGMPGVPRALLYRGTAEAGKALIEGFGFSATDLGWWHNVIRGVVDGDQDALNKATEQVVTNALGMAVLSRGGSGRWYEAFEKGAAEQALKARGDFAGARDKWFAVGQGKGEEVPVERRIGTEREQQAETKPSPAPEAPPDSTPSQRGVNTESTPAPAEPQPLEVAPAEQMSLAQSRIALHGIGNPIGDGERFVYDGDSPPLIVRWTPDAGFEQRQALEETEQWSKMSPQEVDRVRTQAAPSPIPEQVVPADRVARQLVERQDIPPDTMQLGFEALRAMAVIPRGEDQAVDAALSLIEQVPPEMWNARQFDAFNQMVLRGMTPGGRETVLGAFAAMGQEPPPQQPGAQEAPQQEPQGGVPTVVQEGAPREEAAEPTQEQGSDESGKAHVGVAAMGAAAVLGGPTALAGVGGGILARTLYKHWGQDIASRLQYQGDAKLAEPVYRVFQRVRQVYGDNMGEMEPFAQKVRELSDEKPVILGGKKDAIEAARWAQQVTWTPTSQLPASATGGVNKNSKAAYGVSNNLRYVDGWETDQSSLSPAQRRLLEAEHAAIVKSGEMGNRVGVEMYDRAKGRAFRVRFSPDRWRMPRVLTQDGRDVKPGSPHWIVMRDAVQIENGYTMQQAEQQMRLMREERGYRRSAMEFTRTIPKMPDYTRAPDGSEVQWFETRPYEYASRLQDSTARRLANIQVKGQEAVGDAAHPNSPVGIKISPNATPDQIAARKAMSDYVEGSEDPDKALRALVAAERAHAGLPIEQHGTTMGDIVPHPGSTWHSFVRGLWVLRSVYTIAKLPQAAIQNLLELHSTPATYLGAWRALKADARTKLDAFTNWPALMRDAKRYAEMGLIAEMPTRRWGGFSTTYTHAHRALDLARMLTMFAAPNKWANWLNDIAVARATEGLIEDLLAGQVGDSELADVKETLELLDYTAQEQQDILAGNIGDDVARELMRRMRADTMGVRGPERRGFLQGLRSINFIQPFQSYTSNNMRVWGRMLRLAKEASQKGVPLNERYRAWKRIFRHLRGKGLTLAATALAYAMLAYRFNLTAAFAGKDRKETLKNAARQIGTFAAGQELAGPVLGPIMQDAIRGRGDRSWLDAIFDSTWIGSVLNDVGQAVAGTGPYAGRSGKGLAAFPARALELLIQQTPIFRYARQWTEDPELLAYIRRRYDLFPPPDSGSSDAEIPEFQSAMKRLWTKLLGNSVKLTLRNLDEIRDLMREAVAAKPSGDEIKQQQWERMSPDERDAEGWKHVIASLRARLVLRGLDEEHLNELRTRIGNRGMQRLEQLDDQTSDLIDMAESMR